MHAKSIKPAKLSDAIAGYIQKLILEGTLQPGERLLSERDLSTKLDVSRPSLREALEKLIDLGLLRTDSQGSCHVSEALGQSIRDPLMLLMEDPEATFDYLEFRSMIEGTASGLAAQRASELDRTEIKKHFGRMIEAHRNDDPSEHAEADADFHLAIYEATHNTVLLHIMRSMEAILRSDVFFNRKSIYEHRGGADSLLEQHQAIYDAVMAGDRQAATEAAQRHISSTMETIRDLREAEKRLQVSLRRLERGDLVAQPRKRPRRAASRALST
jgi:GntR family transcriptional repressor for pyruvate dehydrogenase complex